LSQETIYQGIPASPGISYSRVYRYQKSDIIIDDGELHEREISLELEEFDKAIERSLKELKKIFEISKERIGNDDSMIFDAQIEILNDQYFINKIRERIQIEKRTAGYIFHDEIQTLGKIFFNSTDEYFRQRFSDIEDVKNRVIRNMKSDKLVSKVEENSIIVAHELTPADTILFSRRKVQGYVTDVGGTTSHAAIISRALRVPAVTGIKNFSFQIKTGEFIILDGFEGLVITNPTGETLERYEQKLSEVKNYENTLLKFIDLPSETLDGKTVSLTVNIEFDEEIDFVTKYGHCDIGLYRTEHLFLEAGDFPSEKYQYDEYSHIANVVYPKTVTIRTYDIGGDKLLPGSQREANPFLGWRGIRLCLDKEIVFREQLRAILMASTLRNIRIMFPMISSLLEFRRAKEILDEVKRELDENEISYDTEIKVGIMVEVPSVYFIASELAKEVDFFSIGTNDLIQYLIAVDRGNEKVADLFDSFHPAVIRFIKKIIDIAHENKIPVSLCGEMASDPKATVLLTGLGIDEMSVVPYEYPEIKSLIRNTNFNSAEKLAEEILNCNNAVSIRQKLTYQYESTRIDKSKNNIGLTDESTQISLP